MRRLVAKGKNYPGYTTLDVTFSSQEPEWHPQLQFFPSPGIDETIDPSDRRKQDIEQRIADA